MPRGTQGFHSMDHEKRRAICVKGGKAAQAKGTAHVWTSEEAAAAGRKGGKRSAELKAAKKAARTVTS